MFVSMCIGETIHTKQTHRTKVNEVYGTSRPKKRINKILKQLRKLIKLSKLLRIQISHLSKLQKKIGVGGVWVQLLGGEGACARVILVLR